MKHFLALITILSFACSSDDPCPTQDSSILDTSISDADAPDVSDTITYNTCNIVNSYPTHLQKWKCKPNDHLDNYWWRMWVQYIDCNDKPSCPPGSVCLNPYIGSSRCATDVLPYCEMEDGIKYYCNTVSDAGFYGWAYQVNGDCLVDECPTGALCIIQMAGIGPVIGECGK
jgi:hypothetical protein